MNTIVTKSKTKSKSKSKSKSGSRSGSTRSLTRSLKKVARNVTRNVAGNNTGNTMEENQNTMMNMVNKSEATNFNAMIRECVKNKEIKQIHRQVIPPVFATKEEYDASFEGVIGFRKSFTDGELKEIDTIVFNGANNDGFFAGAIAYHAIREMGGEIKKIVSAKPNKSWDPARVLDRGCKAIFVDIDWSEWTLGKILEHCSYAIVLDDHAPKMKHPHFYSSWIESKGKNEHSACAVTWKFFYPREMVPTVISYIDSSDAKLYLPWVYYSYMFTEAMGFRYTHSRDPRMFARIQSGEIFEKLWDIIQQSNINDLITFGNYYFQVTEALKEQIAANAHITNFQGYKVGVLNFRSPALAKKVGRQICTNLAGKIDFAVLWGWEYTANGYGITLISDHKTNKVDLRELGDRLKEIGRHPRGGGGRKDEYNLYWPRNDRHDIWELFH